MTAKNLLVTIGATLTAAMLPSAVSAAPPGYDDPVARVEGRICPGVAGMKADAAVEMMDRIRYNADRVGIALADPNVCEPNMLIFFVEDTGKTLNSLMDRQPQLFSALSKTERSDLKSGDSPVRSWSQISTRTRDGMKIYDADTLTQIPRTTMWTAHSKIYVPVRREILTTVVLFDSKAVVGKSLKQLSDYVALRAFANDFTAYPQDRPSILSLFDSAGAPNELTDTDLVFLRTLYSGIPNLPGRFKERSLANALDSQASQ